MGALSILIGGVEHRDYVRQETIRILSSGSSLAATCTFTVEDRLGEAPWINIVEKQDILIADASFPAAALFGGKVAYIEEEHDGPRKTWKVRGSDYTIMLDETIAEYIGGVGETDQDIIVGVFAGTPISAVATPGGFVQLVYGVMEQTAFSGVTLREALSDLARKTGGSYYVDFYQRLHWFALDEGDNAPFNLSTEPDYVTLYPYGQYKRSRDATILINRVQVANYRGIAVWRDDPGSQAEPWGILEGVVRDRNINTMEEAEAYGDWFLSRHAWPKGEPECVCWRPGLRAGMRIQITNSVWGFGPTWYSIRRMELKCMGGTETLVDGLGHIRDPQYEVKLSMGLNDAPGRPDVQPNPDYSPAPPYPPGPPYDEPNPPVTGGTVEVLAEDGTISKVYYTEDFLSVAPTWTGVSTGIPASVFSRMVLDPWETDRAVICGSDGLYMNDAVKNGGAWAQIFSEADFEALWGEGVTNFSVRDVHFSITAKGSLWALVGFNDATPPEPFFPYKLLVAHSHDYGATWAISNDVWTAFSYIMDSACDLEVSQHNADFVWFAVARAGFGVGASRFMESTDGGHTFVHKSNCGDYADPSWSIHVPYNDNDDDLIIWVYGAWLSGQKLNYSDDRGTTWTDRSDGTSRCTVARGGHNLISDNTRREDVYAANTAILGPADFFFSKDEGVTWPAVPMPSVPSGFSILPQAIPNMVLYLGEESNKTGHSPNDYVAARSSQDDGATWVDRTGNLVVLMDADGLGNHRFIDTITPDWLLPGVEEYPPPGEYYEPDGPEALVGYLTPAQHTAIGDGAPHHAPVTIGVDGEHSVAGQVLSGVDAAAAQKGHIQLAGQLGGSAASPDVRGVRETAGPTLLTMGAIADGEFLRRNGGVVEGAAGAGADSDAIHDNVAGEIAAIANKATPVLADHLVIEDSGAGDAKKSAHIGSLPVGHGGAQDANKFLAGPPSGAAADPTFRAQVEADIIDETVTSRKLATTVIEQSCTALTIVNSGIETDITGASISVTPAIASMGIIWATADIDPDTTGDIFVIRLNVDGSNEAAEIICEVPNGYNSRLTVHQVWVVPLSVAAHTIKLRGARAAGSGAANINAIHTKLVLMLLGDANVTNDTSS